MGRVARGKKTTENNKVSPKKVDKKEVTPKKQEVPESASVEESKIEEPIQNGNVEVKTTNKATKSAKGKKESKVENKKPEPKTKAQKNVEPTEVASNDAEVNNEKEAPQVPESKKRATKKKVNEIPEELPAAKKRNNKKEPVSNEKDNSQEKVEEQVENKKDSPKKRGHKDVIKAVEQPKAEPAKKRAKKDETVPVNTEEKKKPTRGKKTVEEPPKEEIPEVEKPATKKSRGKNAAKKDEEVAKEKTPEPEPEKPATTKQAKAKASKKVDNQEVEKSSPKAKKPKGKAAKEVEPEENTEEVDGVNGSSPKQTKRGAKKNEKPAEGKKLLNSITSDFDIDFDIKTKWNYKIAMWNTSGLRSCVEKGCVEYFKRENPDVICLNEIKCGSEAEIPEKIKLDGYHAYWNVGKGMPGVGILSKQMPMEVFFDLPGQFSEEKRLITAEYKKFYLVCTYVVNAGRGLKTLDKRLEWNKVFDNYIKELDKKKPVIITGDMNVAHTEIDLANPKSNQKNAGFTKEEREGFTQLLSYGFVDTFRNFYPDQKGAYTFWSYMNNARAKNVGWRLDYFITSERFVEKVKDNVIRSTIKGSDHCPIVLFLDI